MFGNAPLAQDGTGPHPHPATQRELTPWVAGGCGSVPSRKSLFRDFLT